METPLIQTYDRQWTNHNTNVQIQLSQEASVTHTTSNRDIVNLKGIWKGPKLGRDARHASSAAVSIGQEICGLLLQLRPDRSGINLPVRRE
jgi:hypothetical protein